MSGLGGFLKDIAVAGGNMMIYGTEQEQRQANLAATKTDTAFKQMSLQMQQKQFQDNQQLAADVAVGLKGLGDAVKIPGETAKMLGELAVQQGAKGNWKGVEELSKLAKDAQSQADHATVQAAKIAQAGKEVAAQSARSYLDAPSAEAAQTLVQNALKAGVPMKDIPLITDPKFASWAKGQQLAPLSGEQAMTYLEKVRETDAKLKQTQQRLDEAHADKIARARETASFHEGLLSLRRDALDARAQKGPGDKIGVNEQARSDKVISSTAQAFRALENQMSLSQEAVTSVFGKLKAGTPLEAMTAAAGNILTPEQDQAFTAIGKELGVVTAQVISSAGGGSRVTQPLIDSFQDMTSGKVGDSVAMKVLRIANVSEILKTELTTIVPGATPELEAHRQRMIDLANSFPTVKQVIAGMNAADKKRTLGEAMALARAGQTLTGQIRAAAAEQAAQPTAAPVATSDWEKAKAAGFR
jgi:hypothetical protein